MRFLSMPHWHRPPLNMAVGSPTVDVLPLGGRVAFFWSKTVAHEVSLPPWSSGGSLVGTSWVWDGTMWVPMVRYHRNMSQSRFI